MIFLRYINYYRISSYSFLLYIISNLFLLYVLLFGKVINGSRAWINVLGIGFQPSEFTKISLLLCFDRYIDKKNGIIKCIILLVIPSVLTFLEPDTGTVIFYFVIFVSILLSLKLKRKYYIYSLSILSLLIFSFFLLFFFKSDLFIRIFGSSFFYRIDRIINFISNEGFQINNALIGIGSGGVFGRGIEYVIYIPEAITDFMFATLLMRFGYIVGLIVIIIYIFLDFSLISDIRKISKHKYYVIGLFGLLLYQQLQHMLMNVGLLPITGITLPFVSYGGSSLISYYILFGILLNIKKYQIDT